VHVLAYCLDADALLRILAGCLPLQALLVYADVAPHAVLGMGDVHRALQAATYARRLFAIYDHHVHRCCRFPTRMCLLQLAFELSL